jgi:hypothetical protein
MRLRTISLGILLGTAVVVGWSQESAPHPPSLIPSGATNELVVHLQDGFYGNREVVVKVDGREVYRGLPETSPVLGLAKLIPVKTTSLHPIVIFAMPGEHITWSNQVNLSAGTALGIIIQTNGVVKVRQAKEFGYD